MTEIPKRVLGRTGEEVTIFGLGGEGVLRTRGRVAEAVEVIHRALDLGVNYFDSAPAYAGCLDYLGVGLEGRRDGVFVASKTHDRTRDGSLRLLDETLRRLKTDRLDLWQLHDLRTKADLDHIFGKKGAMEALLQAREEGRVRFLGVTGHHDPAILHEAMLRFDFDTVLVAVNVADRHRLSFIDSVLPESARQGMGAIAMKVFAQGALLEPGGVAVQDALTYALSLQGISTAIVGCSTPQEVEANAAIAKAFVPMTSETMQDMEHRTALRAAAFCGYKRPVFTQLEM